MAVTFDAVGPSSSGAGNAASTTLSWNHTCAASATVLYAGVALGVTGDGGFTLAVTYDGVSMTSMGVVHSANGTNGFLQVFKLLNPHTGSALSVAVTASGGTPGTLSGGSLSYIGGVSDSATATSFRTGVGALSATVNGTTSGNLVAAFLACGTNGSTSTAPATSRFAQSQNNSTAAGNSGGEDTAAGGNVTIGWSAADDSAIIAFEVQGSSGTAGQVLPTRPFRQRLRARFKPQVAFWNAGTASVTGPPVYPLHGPVRAVQLPATTRRGAGVVTNRSGPLGVTGPPVRMWDAPIQARSPVLRLLGRIVTRTGIQGVLGPAVRIWHGPVRGQPGVPFLKGRSSGRAGAYGGIGPPVRPQSGPVRGRPGFPFLKGRASGRSGAYGQLGPPVTPQRGPVRGQPTTAVRYGRVQSRAGTFTSVTPVTGPPVYPLGHPVQAKIPPGRSIGRVQTRRGVYGQTGPPLRPPSGPVTPRRPGPFRTGRTTGRSGPYGGSGPPVRQWDGPVRTTTKPPALRGRTRTSLIPVAATPSSAVFPGTVTLTNSLVNTATIGSSLVGAVVLTSAAAGTATIGSSYTNAVVLTQAAATVTIGNSI